jgi:hypothetical protein
VAAVEFALQLDHPNSSSQHPGQVVSGGGEPLRCRFYSVLGGALTIEGGVAAVGGRGRPLDCSLLVMNGVLISEPRLLLILLGQPVAGFPSAVSSLGLGISLVGEAVSGYGTVIALVPGPFRTGHGGAATPRISETYLHYRAHECPSSTNARKATVQSLLPRNRQSPRSDSCQIDRIGCRQGQIN